MTATTLKTLIINTVKLDAQLQRNAADLTKQAKGMSLKAWRNAVASILGEHYGVDPHESQKFHWLTFEKDTAAEQMLKKFHRLHPKADAQQSSGKREPVVVAQAKVDAAIKIAQGMTKAEFNAWLKLVRESVSFQ